MIKINKNENIELIHIIPSGMDLSLCGISNAEGTSLGCTCTCKKCLELSMDIIKKPSKTIKLELVKENPVKFAKEVEELKCDNSSYKGVEYECK